MKGIRLYGAFFKFQILIFNYFWSVLVKGSYSKTRTLFFYYFLNKGFKFHKFLQFNHILRKFSNFNRFSLLTKKMTEMPSL